MEPSESFEHFDQQERSWSHLDELGPKLIEEATAILAEHPNAEVAGLMAEAGSSAYQQLKAVIERNTGQVIDGAGFVGVLPRRIVIDVIEATTGQKGVEWIEQTAPTYLPRLPVVAVTRDGIRMASLELPGG